MTFIISLLLTLTVSLQASTPADPTDLYYVVFLRAAPERPPISSTDAERIQSAHMANIHAMEARGVLVAAGPFDDSPTTISGIFVFKVASIDEARRIAAEDPTVVEHRNVVDVVAWRAPRDIGVEYKRLHAERPETPVGMGLQPFYLIYRGPSLAARDTPAAALKEHADYVDQLRTTGKIGAAGLTDHRPDLLSIVIFNRIPEDEAARLMSADPAVKSGALRSESHRWWCADHVLPGADKITGGSLVGSFSARVSRDGSSHPASR
jgi:uncharacterized protein YciI